MLVKLSTDKTVSETWAALQAAAQANHFAGDVQYAPTEKGGRRKRRTRLLKS
jgi:hypothetical protein